MAPVVAPRRASELVSSPLPSRPAPRCLIQRGEMPAQTLLFLPQPHARPLAVLDELDAGGPKGTNNLTHSVIPTAQSVVLCFEPLDRRDTDTRGLGKAVLGPI